MGCDPAEDCTDRGVQCPEPRGEGVGRSDGYEGFVGGGGLAVGLDQSSAERSSMVESLPGCRHVIASGTCCEPAMPVSREMRCVAVERMLISGEADSGLWLVHFVHHVILLGSLTCSLCSQDNCLILHCRPGTC